MLGEVDPESEGELAAVRRRLLQEIVLWEFGSDFRQHPEFAPMLDTIERAFEIDPQAPKRLKRLMDVLRG